MEKKKENSIIHIPALVLGIISVLSTLFYYISLPAGILAIIFGVKAVKKTGSNMGKAGIVLGIIGISICILEYITMVIVLVSNI